MSEGNETFLRFSLEESVWFQKGQEVAELISISLDPNITIHENEAYVTLEGALLLTGEYNREQVEYSAEEEFPTSPKFIQQVEDRGEGVSEFSHRFPVDITIPTNRIESIYDINVEIESFDYAFPERSCMKLTADLTITGLKGNTQPSPSTETQQQEEQEPELAYRAVEVSIEKETPEVEQIEETVPPANELFAPFIAEARKTDEENNEEEHNFSPIPVEIETVPTLQVEENKQSEFPDISFSAQRQESPENNESHTVQLEQEHESPALEEIESSSSSSSEVVIKKKKKSKKQGISITEFLARKEVEEDVAKLKVCIVQHGDTIETLAERYDIPSQQILRVNHLELNQDIFEGQVLYIPIAVAHN